MRSSLTCFWQARRAADVLWQHGSGRKLQSHKQLQRGRHGPDV